MLCASVQIIICERKKNRVSRQTIFLRVVLCVCVVVRAVLLVLRVFFRLEVALLLRAQTKMKLL